MKLQPFLDSILETLKLAYGKRLVYLGLQGSYSRGEADEHSDIDLMLVLDHLSPDDLLHYRQLLCESNAPASLCGFVCGRRELKNWNACEIFQLVEETKDCYGRLHDLIPSYTDADIRTQVKISAGNLYHEICHRFLYESQEENLQMLPYSYKAAFYILQNLYYLRHGIYISKKQELLSCLEGTEFEVLQMCISLRTQPVADFKRAYDLLFTWCQQVICSV